MRSIAKILLPVDFSERSKTAVQYGTHLSERFNSELTILHVLPTVIPPPHEYPELYVGILISPEVLEERRKQAGIHLDNWLRADLGKVTVTRLVDEGDPATQIVQQAHDGGFDLIMMPTHGYGPFRQLLLGSVTAKVLDGADCPVWTGVHVETQSVSEPIDVKHVVCAVDLGPQSAAVVEWGSRMAAEFRARLSLLHVVALDPRTESYYFSPEWRGQLMEGARAGMHELQAVGGPETEIHIQVGDVQETLRTAATNLQADLLVTGRGAKSASAGRLPTHVYAIIRDSPCPVVSV